MTAFNRLIILVGNATLLGKGFLRQPVKLSEFLEPG